MNWRVILAAGALVAAIPAPSNADEYVHGYYRSNGTYVAPYYRSSPDNSYNNNWSVEPNVNPNTGQAGTRLPTWDNRPPRGSSYGNGGCPAFSSYC